MCSGQLLQMSSIRCLGDVGHGCKAILGKNKDLSIRVNCADHVNATITKNEDFSRYLGDADL